MFFCLLSGSRSSLEGTLSIRDAILGRCVVSVSKDASSRKRKNCQYDFLHRFFGFQHGIYNNHLPPIISAHPDPKLGEYFPWHSTVPLGGTRYKGRGEVVYKSRGGDLAARRWVGLLILCLALHTPSCLFSIDGKHKSSKGLDGVLLWGKDNDMVVSTNEGPSCTSFTYYKP